ncbi:short-chain dehydrogenase [Devosia sp. Root413D1]|uniref:NnrS family protein n=1 Tax=Devosia sp. Root413D1 TaxID=1736531 RepID=UPI0006F613DD|nr:NnrS family protein [Devosia sp. Root413D1]KQW75605.1 short-chain dehydrogenase [Devosia sp. Root413D1]
MNFGLGNVVSKARKPVPRGIARSGPPVLSYGFRPFFLLAGIFAIAAMLGWIGALTAGWEIGGDYGMLNWHAHEMLFGYTSAALAGYMLTAIPNWTGRLPVSGLPLLGLVAVWLVGRLVMAVPGVIGLPLSMLAEACFLPLMAVIAATEIIAGENWKNLKILAGLSALSLVNIAFHVSVAFNGVALEASRAGVAIYVMLIAVVGGRIVPSFTRNWLAKAGSPRLPAPFGRFDIAATAWLLVTLVLWVVFPETIVTACAAVGAAILHAVRLARWHGQRTVDEPLLLALHVGYAFIPLGMLSVALASVGWIANASALHVLTVGAIAGMTFAVMTRASLGHTGRALTASPRTSVAYLALTLSAVLRPFAELIPSQYHLLLSLSGACWLIAFGLFVLEFGPMLVSPRLKAG